ncbi:MAG: beta-lactamase family protein, partial [Gemmatimonadaceae bacterium]|nr:beta-lactamase family protein [Gemmatimonadaceae bacterium]
MRPHVLALLLAAVLGGPLDAQKPVPFATAWAPVRQFFHATLTAEGVVGGTLVFFHGDTVLAREYHGLADLATQRKVDERTIYHWASVTKTITAIALMQLRDRGRLTLDDPAVQHVPELAMAHSAFGPVRSITLRHLLSHSSGFQNSTWPWVGYKPWYPHEPTQWAQLVAMLPYTETAFAPGTKYSYSNPAYIYLGRTIETLAGEDFEVYAEKNVLRPLGMTASYYDRTPYHLLADRSNNYDVTDGTATPNGLDFDTGITVANGGLNAPVGDMVRYLQFLVGAPGVSAVARGVLPRATLDEMFRPVLPLTASATDSIGLGFFVVRKGAQRLIGHTGSQKAFRSFVYVDPVTQAGAILVLNTAPAEATSNPTNSVPGRPRIGVIFGGVLDRLVSDVFS